MVIEHFHGLGKYGQGHDNDLNTLASNIPMQTPAKNSKNGLQLIIAAGGNVAAVAASASTSMIPLLVAYGKAEPAVESSPYVRGYNLGMDSGGNYPNPTQFIVNKLISVYKVPANSQLCLFYNNNSRNAADQQHDWNNNAPGAVSYDASQGASNSSIGIGAALQNAIDKLDPTKKGAIVITSDPYFSLKKSQIIHHLKRIRQSNPNFVVAFPFIEYWDEATVGGVTANDCLALGPTLKDVYNQLGQSAGAILTSFPSPPSATGTAGVSYAYKGN